MDDAEYKLPRILTINMVDYIRADSIEELKDANVKVIIRRPDGSVETITGEARN